MVSYPIINLVDSIIDEVALEGLDGITLEALWLRLANRFHDPLPLPKAFMEQVWSICVRMKPFTFWFLEKPRSTLVLVDRYEYVDPDLGTILEPDNVPEDIYPHCPIDDSATGDRGSCSSYRTRKDISSIVIKLSLDETLEKYGQSLVIVASQNERERALMGENVCPTLDLNVIQYCFLERVGRARYHGEVTQGKLSLNCLDEDPKSLFYHRKSLLRHKLITKQMHHQKSVSSGHSCRGSLLHLPRFFVERKPKVIFLAEQVINVLKSKENYVAEYKEIKKALQIENCIKKLFKTAFFQKVVKADIRVPYRTVYPNADIKEWQHKNHPPNEKLIRVVQLVDPNIDINELWNKDEIHDDEESFDIEISNHKYNVPFLKQANAIVEETKRNGIHQGQLGSRMGLTKLQSRTILRNLVKANLVATYMNDIGRQRLTKYVSKKFEKSSEMSRQFEKELHKIKELSKSVVTRENFETTIKIEKEEIGDEDETVSNDLEEVSGGIEEKNKENVDDKSGPENSSQVSLCRRKNLFKIVAGIFRKYRSTKFIVPYDCRFSRNVCKPLRKIASRQRRKTEETEETIATIVSEDVEVVSIYNNVKTNLTTQRSVRSGKAVEEALGFMEDVKSNEENDMPNITYRLLKRANLIIESVKENQVIDDCTKLLKMITEEEDKEGYDVKIDKKSLMRLLNKLAKDNLIKIIKLTLSVNNREKHLTFICNPNIDVSHTVIKSAVEQAKIKFSLITSNRLKLNARQSNDKPENSSLRGKSCEKNEKDGKEREFTQQKQTPNYKIDTKIARVYGHGPKFVRLKVLHILLYYMMYDHPGEQVLTKEEQIEKLEKAGHTIPRSLRKEMSTVYKTEVGWKMFIPPLPRHGGWPKGWTLICDVLLRTPLSIFLKIHRVIFVMPDLEAYIKHPIRKHFLVKNLPLNIRNALFHNRKYIFDFHHSATRLCFLGLLQFGPQRLKEKDQVFIYVNKRSELWDTTSSGPSYHRTEEKNYPKTIYEFNEIQVVEKYWYDMWNICINTPLGGRLAVQGKDILLEELEKKSEMIEAAKARSPEETILMDSGNVPGDRRGAAGLDSAFFAHLKRNWNWNDHLVKKQPTYETPNERFFQRQTYLSQIKAKPFKFTEFPGFKKVTGPSNFNAKNLKNEDLRNKSHENVDSKNTVKKPRILTSQRSAKQKTFVRTVLPRKIRNRARIKYDEIDYRALQRMHKLRVDWEPYEDSMLLICKVAMTYLCPSYRKQLVSFTAVRDFLRSCSSSSCNKTSRACQRRLLYMMKGRDSANSVALGVEEIKQNYFINKRFGGAVDKIREQCDDPAELEERVAQVFRELVSYIAKKYFDLSDIGRTNKQPFPVPKTAQEFNIFYRIIQPSKPFGNRGFLKDVKNVDDIQSATLNSVIHSSMCCGKDRRAWAYQLFKIYQQYPEALLQNSMSKIRDDQMVTVKKNKECVLKKYGNCMPMSSSQYQLSNYYAHKFNAKWPYDVFKETYEVFKKFLAEQDCPSENGNFGTEVSPVTGGTVTIVHDFFEGSRLDVDIEIPDQMIMLDPRLHEKDETYLRIAKRYQDILDSLDHPLLNDDYRTKTYGKVEEFSGCGTPTAKRKLQDNEGYNETKKICKRDVKGSENQDTRENVEKSDLTDLKIGEGNSKDVKKDVQDEKESKTKANKRPASENNCENLLPLTKKMKSNNPEDSLPENRNEQSQTLEMNEEIIERIEKQGTHSSEISDTKENKETKEINSRDDEKRESKENKETKEINSRDDEKRESKENKETKEINSRDDEKRESKEFKETKEINSRDDEERESKENKETKEINSRDDEKRESMENKETKEINSRDDEKRESKENKETKEINSRDDEKRESKENKETKEINSRDDEERESKENKETKEINSRDDEKRESKENKETKEINSRDDEKRESKENKETKEINSRDDEKRESKENKETKEINSRDDEKRESKENKETKEINSRDDEKRESKENKETKEINSRDNEERESKENSETKEINSRDDEKRESKEFKETQSSNELSKFYDGSYTRVSEILRTIPCEPTGENPPRKFEDATDAEKRYTRIALLKMREELNDLNVVESHHAHDLFVVNMCKIGYTLRGSKSNLNFVDFEDRKVSVDILPLTSRKVDEVVEEIKSTAVFPKDVIPYADCKKNLLKDSSISWSKYDAVYKFVREKKELGASALELMERFYDTLGRDLYEIISTLTKHHIFLRSGVTVVRYIHHSDVSPWLIRSYKIHRFDEDQETLKSSTTQPEVNGRKESKELEDVVRLITEDVSRGDRSAWENDREKVKTVEARSKDEPTTLSNNNETKRNENPSSESEDDDTQVTGKIQGNGNALLPRKDIYMAAKQLDFKTAEEIRVVMKPWIRIDGILNRKVLDRMLGAVLSYCLTHPGVTLSKVQSRFVPPLQPFQTFELVEILVKIGCLERKVLKKSRVTLFSKPFKVKPKIGDDWASEEEIFLEPMSLAILKFSLFRSKEVCNIDYIP